MAIYSKIWLLKAEKNRPMVFYSMNFSGRKPQLQAQIVFVYIKSFPRNAIYHHTNRNPISQENFPSFKLKSWHNLNFLVLCTKKANLLASFLEKEKKSVRVSNIYMYKEREGRGNEFLRMYT